VSCQAHHFSKDQSLSVGMASGGTFR
jgi:hypothetical protein